VSGEAALGDGHRSDSRGYDHSPEGQRIRKESLMVKLGHADFRTSQHYVNLAGVVFADEAAALDVRMNGSAVESSTNPVYPERTSDELLALGEGESLSAD
jgi:hypothetical protein